MNATAKHHSDDDVVRGRNADVMNGTANHRGSVPGGTNALGLRDQALWSKLARTHEMLG